MLNGGFYGASTPVTLPGALITSIAEMIGGIVLIQVIKPGNGVGERPL